MIMFLQKIFEPIMYRATSRNAKKSECNSRNIRPYLVYTFKDVTPFTPFFYPSLSHVFARPQFIDPPLPLIKLRNLTSVCLKIWKKKLQKTPRPEICQILLLPSTIAAQPLGKPYQFFNFLRSL